MSRPELPDQETLLRDEVHRARCALKHSYDRLGCTIQDTRAAEFVRRHPMLVSAGFGLICGAGLHALAANRGDGGRGKRVRRKKKTRSAVAAAIIAQARIMAMSWLGGFLARSTEVPLPPEGSIGSNQDVNT